MPQSGLRGRAGQQSNQKELGGRTVGSKAVCVVAFPMPAITLRAVMFIVADLDRPQEGMLRVGQQLLVDLRATMRQPNP